jgi:hypothetical protein
MLIGEDATLAPASKMSTLTDAPAKSSPRMENSGLLAACDQPGTGPSEVRALPPPMRERMPSVPCRGRSGPRR